MVPGRDSQTAVGPHMRLTSWTIQRDFDKERAIVEKVGAAREYYAQAIAEFDQIHQIHELLAA